ncbi:MAG: hypothetical protein FWH11_02490 [Micrococcales bacterium]|nr:hypothetical protein [Micrococcales bacterium]
MSHPPPSPYYVPAPPRRRRAPLIAAVAAVVVVALVALGVWLLVRGSGPTASPTATVNPCDEQPYDPQIGPTKGNASLGDPYLCWAGGAGYDALSYDVQVSVEPATAQITGQAEVVVRLTEEVDAVHLDLVLQASAVTVDGASVEFAQDGLDLAVPTDARVGDEVTIGVEYSGVPKMRSEMGEAVRRQGSEILLADEPAGPVTWMPINSHPSDPAMFSVAVSVPRGVEAISVGRLVSNGPDPDAPGRDLWVWAADEPVVSYAIMLAVGQYELDGPRNVTVGGKTVQYVAAAPVGAEAEQALEWLSRSIEAADALTEFAGEYPLTSLGGIVPPMPTGWALETHGRPIYDSVWIPDDSVITHELAHFWFGNKVVLTRWDDIVTKEGLASYSEYAADFTGRNLTPEEFLESTYDDNRLIDWNQSISDPGSGLDAYSYKVYQGGGAALQALRNRMGDEAFGAFIKAWADQEGPHSLEEFRQMAQEYSPTDVSGLLAAWFDDKQRPARTAENGLGG